MVSLSSPNTHCYDGFPCPYAGDFAGDGCQESFDATWEKLHDPTRRQAARFLIDAAENDRCPARLQRTVKETIEFEKARLALALEVADSEIQQGLDKGFDDSL